MGEHQNSPHPLNVAPTSLNNVVSKGHRGFPIETNKKGRAIFDPTFALAQLNIH
jgi:hypothetical protein